MGKDVDEIFIRSSGQRIHKEENTLVGRGGIKRETEKEKDTEEKKKRREEILNNWDEMSIVANRKKELKMREKKKQQILRSLNERKKTNIRKGREIHD